MNKSCIAAALISAFAFTTSAAPLKILIVNDDGCESTGSISLQEKLTQKGTVENDTDSGWLNKGYITYSLFDGAMNAPQFQAQYEELLSK